MLLPFVSVWLDIAAKGEEGVEVGNLVEQHHQKKVLWQVAIDANFVVRMERCGTAIVAKLGIARRSDFELHFVLAYELVYWLNG